MNKESCAILVVDDDQELRQTIAEILVPEGFQVLSAENADRALELLAQTPCALVLLDMIMPGTDGMTAISLIRKIAPKIRIVIITAYASVGNAVQAMQKGADDYLTKPFKIDELLTTVRRNLAQAAADCGPECGDIDAIFQGLANQLRRRIIITLGQKGECRFMELVRALGVEDHTKVNFHLKILREGGFITQSGNKTYLLTPAGHRAADCLILISKGI